MIKDRKKGRVLRRIGILLILFALAMRAVSLLKPDRDTQEKNEPYPYVMFADKKNLDSENVLIHGDCGDGNKEEMIDQQRLIIKKYITGSDGTKSDPYFADDEIKWNETLDCSIGSLSNILITQNKVETKDTVLYSRHGNITIEGTDIDYSGLIYAPEGKVKITGEHINMDAIIIAKNIEMKASDIEIKKNKVFAKLLGSRSDTYQEKRDIYTFQYNIFDNISDVFVGQRHLVHYNYKDSFHKCLLKEVYGNGTLMDYEQDDVVDVSNEREGVMKNYRIQETGFDDYSQITEADDKDINLNCTYDEKNQLTRVDDKNLEKTFLYFYDNRGNMVVKQEYAYTDGKPVNAQKEIKYFYDNEWPDCLISYDGKKVKSDQCGNPISCKGWKYTWGDGGILTSAKSKSHDISFTYDYFGLRISKSENGVETVYKYCGNKVLEQDNGTDKIIFLYDTYGSSVGMKINGQIYYYIKNQEGDVKWIVKKSGEIVTEYSYDPWGKVLKVSGKMADTVGKLNPIRFHGYYYDAETKLYYIINRYYDPELCRFISPDDFEFCVSDNNLYQYCGNDPIKNTSARGHNQ